MFKSFVLQQLQLLLLKGSDLELVFFTALHNEQIRSDGKDPNHILRVYVYEFCFNLGGGFEYFFFNALKPPTRCCFNLCVEIVGETARTRPF